MEKVKENIQFRILYFIGIILIVAGHCGGGSILVFNDWFPVYSFHVALFVFCSGYFFIKKKDVSFLEFLKKLLFKFIIPLYVWNLVYGIILIILHHFGFNFGKPFNLYTLFILPLTDGHQFQFNLATWFIPPLLLSQLFNFFIVKLIGNKKKLYYIHFIISLLLGFLGVYLSIKGFNKSWGLLLCRTLYFIPFFSLGLLYKSNLEDKDIIPNIVYFLVIFAITYVVAYIFGGVRGYTPSWCKSFDNFYRPYIVGFLGIAFWLRISRILVPTLKDSRLVNYISKNTYSIMTHHYFGFFILNTSILIMSKFCKFIEYFNIRDYKNSISYIYLPRKLGQFRLVYLIFGFVFSLFVAFIIEKSKKIIKFKIKKAR